METKPTRVTLRRAPVTDSTCSHCHSSEQSWRAGTAAAALGTGVGGKLKRRGMRKPGCSFFASASSSALLAQTFPVPQELLQQQLPNPLDERNFLDLNFCQFLEETDKTWKNHPKKIAPQSKGSEHWETQASSFWPPSANTQLPHSSQGCSDCSSVSNQPGSMEEQEDNLALSFGANASKCSLETNQTGASPCWSGATRGGPEVVIVPVLFGFIFLLGMVGNTLVLVVLGRLRPGGRPSRSATNIFILNLSIADFSFLLFCVPFQATIYSLPEWIFGAFFCKWVHYLAMATMLVSIFTLVAMSVDRYIAVVHAKRSSGIRSKRNAALGVGIIWLLSLLIAIPVAQHQALVSGHQQAPNSSFCWENWPDGSTAKQTYKVTILLVGYLLPLVLITCCYAKVSKRDVSNTQIEERINPNLLVA